MGTLYVDQYTLLIISCLVLCRMRNVSDKSFIENQTHILYSENCALYEIIWKNIVEPDGSQMQYGACELHAGCQRLRPHTHSEYVIFIAFLLQQWLNDNTTVLC